MYTAEQLAPYHYFQPFLHSGTLTSLHDSLTGVIARPFMLQLVQSLVGQGTPFALAILDLDNFKHVNDTYGHRAGDAVLQQMGARLQAYVGSSGLVGRYGGDEFLLLYRKDISYDGIHAFFDGMFSGRQVFRKRYPVGDVELSITATIGCAAYPANAQDFDTLFALIDKALYRGKTKGRNCFIIYVPQKHDRLEMPQLTRRSLYETFTRMAAGFDAGQNLDERLRLAFQPMAEQLRLQRLLRLDASGSLYDTGDGTVLGALGRDCPLPDSPMFGCSYPGELACISPELSRILEGLGFDAVLMLRLEREDCPLRCLILCPEAHSQHIWQDEERAAAFFLARMVLQS